LAVVAELIHAWPLASDGGDVDELLTVLGRQQHVLEILLFRLLEARGLLATGEVRFLHLAAQDIDAACEAVREVELRRALLPLADGTTLRQLADVSPSPLSEILHEHLLDLSRLAAEVGAASEAVSELSAVGVARARDRELVGTVPGRRRTSAPMDDLDREIVAAGYESVFTASARLMLPSLVAFLG
jgi:hypothetical protein